MSIYFNTLCSDHHKRLTRKKSSMTVGKKLLYSVVPVYDILKRWYSGRNNTMASDYSLFLYIVKKKERKKKYLLKRGNNRIQ